MITIKQEKMMDTKSNVKDDSDYGKVKDELYSIVSVIENSVERMYSAFSPALVEMVKKEVPADTEKEVYSSDLVMFIKEISQRLRDVNDSVFELLENNCFVVLKIK